MFIGQRNTQRSPYLNSDVCRSPPQQKVWTQLASESPYRKFRFDSVRSGESYKHSGVLYAWFGESRHAAMMATRCAKKGMIQLRIYSLCVFCVVRPVLDPCIPSVLSVLYKILYFSCHTLCHKRNGEGTCRPNQARNVWFDPTVCSSGSADPSIYNKETRLWTDKRDRVVSAYPGRCQRSVVFTSSRSHHSGADNDVTRVQNIRSTCGSDTKGCVEDPLIVDDISLAELVAGFELVS